MLPPQFVLRQFGFTLTELRWQPAPRGFSGAEVWRGEDGDRALFALKAWPEGFSSIRLAGIHRRMAQAADLLFVPKVLPATSGLTAVLDAGRLWETTDWMPGSPRQSPTLPELRAACKAVAQLHAAWSTNARCEPCRGVHNRLELLRSWMASPRSDLAFSFIPGLDSLVSRAVVLITRASPEAIRALERWEHRSLRTHACLRDLRSEHVLFNGSEVGGIVDYGAMAEDHPAVDLARLLGDFSWDNESYFSAALESYREAGGILETPDVFVEELARTGLLGSAIHWLRRLGNPGGCDFMLEQVEARFAHLIERIEQFSPVR